MTCNIQLLLNLNFLFISVIFFLSHKIPTSTEIFSSYLINDRYILDQFCPISSKKETYIYTSGKDKLHEN